VGALRRELWLLATAKFSIPSLKSGAQLAHTAALQLRREVEGGFGSYERLGKCVEAARKLPAEAQRGKKWCRLAIRTVASPS
jgi:hypothetical protein